MAMRVICLVLMLTVTSDICAQQAATFQYNPRDKTLLKSVPAPFIDAIIRSKRIFMKDSVIRDTDLLCKAQSDTCSIDFRLDKYGNWYAEMNGESQLFFDAKSQKLQTIKTGFEDRFMVPIKRQFNAGSFVLLGFILKYVDSENAWDGNVYWFHEDFGIVVLESQGGYYVRNDFEDALRSH
jgi:hypothetical protein